MIYALNPPFNRHLGDVVIGDMVRALEQLLGSSEAKHELSDRVHYLRRRG